MHVNVDYAVRAARTGNPSMLVSLLRGYFHGTADLGMSVLEAQNFIRGFPKEWAAATEDEPIIAAAAPTKTTGKQAAETYARRAAEREARTTAVWDEAIANANRRLGVENDPGKPRRVSFL
jgi:hypothetical protein